MLKIIGQLSRLRRGDGGVYLPSPRVVRVCKQCESHVYIGCQVQQDVCCTLAEGVDGEEIILPA